MKKVIQKIQSYLFGFGRLLDIGGTYNTRVIHRVTLGDFRTDSEALAKDWRAVVGDFNIAFRKLKDAKKH